MTTYDGRGYKYDSKGKEVVNKEPPVSKHIVEKLYRIHRENVIHCTPLTDCHVDIPKFLTDVSWKKLGEQKKKRDQIRRNELIYGRIAKVENAESRITKDIREHVRRTDDVKQKMLKLSETGRLKHLLKIQKDNTIILERIERARPSITAQGIKEWYQPHITYKDGRLVHKHLSLSLSFTFFLNLFLSIPHLSQSNYWWLHFFLQEIRRYRWAYNEWYVSLDAHQAAFDWA